MDERVMQFRVGVFFLATLILVAILLVLFGKMPTYIGSYPVQVRFDNAGGITTGAPVYKSGVLIGRVAGIRLTDHDQKVLVTLDIQSDKRIYKDETPYITRDLMGNTSIVFAPMQHSVARHEPIESGEPLTANPSEVPAGLREALKKTMETVGDTGDALKLASEKLAAAAERVDNILNDKTQIRIQQIIDDTAASMKVIRKGLGDENNQKKLADALNKLPDTLEKMNNTFARTDEALKTFTEPTGEDRRSSVERLEHSIKIVEERLEKFTKSDRYHKAPADQIAKTVENINEITRLMRDIMSRIDEGEGSLGALLKDRQLYDRLNRAARNIEQVSRELRPIVDDAGVFMDKAARHPGVIVRDAIKPGAGIK